MEESGCDQAEAELALQITSYNLKKPRPLEDNPARHRGNQGKFFIESEIFYGLFIIIVNKRARNIVRLRCAISITPNYMNQPEYRLAPDRKNNTYLQAPGGQYTFFCEYYGRLLPAEVYGRR